MTNLLREKLNYVNKYMCKYIHRMDNILKLYLLHPKKVETMKKKSLKCVAFFISNHRKSVGIND